MTTMHKGLLLYPQGGSVGQQVNKVVLGKAVESFPGSGVMVDQEAKWGWFNDAGTMRRWARQCPRRDPLNVFTSLVSLPTDPDPNFRVSLPSGEWTGFDHTITIVVVRVSTGIAAFWSVVGNELSWASDGGGEQYHVNLTLFLTKDNSFPSEFDDYQISGDGSAGAQQTYTDPREGV
jgi:hypothetical protein